LFGTQIDCYTSLTSPPQPFTLSPTSSVNDFTVALQTPYKPAATTPNWLSHLPWFLLSNRSSPHHDLTNLSTAGAIFGDPLAISFHLPLKMTSLNFIPNSNTPSLASFPAFLLLPKLFLTFLPLFYTPNSFLFLLLLLILP
jgi:hypothetical protein